MSIISKSNILSWSLDSLVDAPTQPGVYVLRNIPSLNGIIYIGYSDNIKTDLTKRLNNNTIPDTLWFDWYETESLHEAEELQQYWVSKYTPKYNTP